MAKKQVFQFVIFYNPTTDTKDPTDVAEIVQQGFIVATDAEKAKLLASRRIPEKFESKIADVEVLVRPF